MREILFRGKRADNGELIISNSIQQMSYGKVYLWYEGFWVEVIPESVGQYPGLTDRNGKNIFEGDILAIITTVKGDWTIDENGHYKEPKRKDCAVVQKDKNTGGYRLKVYHNGRYKRISRFDVNHIHFHYRAEVIGNIYDNPELLEAEE